jgi:hypothetical protein
MAPAATQVKIIEQMESIVKELKQHHRTASGH